MLRLVDIVFTSTSDNDDLMQVVSAAVPQLLPEPCHALGVAMGQLG